MLLIPVVVVIGGILALVLYLEKKSHPIEGRAPNQRPHAVSQPRRAEGRALLRGLSSGAPGSSLGCAPGRKLAIQRTKGPARRKKPPRRETARGIERAPTRKLKRSPHPMRSGAGQTGTGLGGSVTTRRLYQR